MKAGRTLVDDLGSRLRNAGYIRKWIILGLVIGAVAGLGAIAFTEALHLATRFFLVGLGGYQPPSPLAKVRRSVPHSSRAPGPSPWSSGSAV